ncbi:MAG TPA: hypothetical protein VJ852_03165 [Gemmatimonadaceae bacterium]|nr:hypothetical protein [Gemmatimonadaceae bacterium]
MAITKFTTVAVALALALVSRASTAQSASVSLTHTVVVTVPPRVKVQVSPAPNQQQSATAQSGLAVNVNATRGWALVVGSKKQATPKAQWVASNGERMSSVVLYRNQLSERSPDLGGASDSEPLMLTVVAP